MSKKTDCGTGIFGLKERVDWKEGKQEGRKGGRGVERLEGEKAKG